MYIIFLNNEPLTRDGHIRTYKTRENALKWANEWKNLKLTRYAHLDSPCKIEIAELNIPHRELVFEFIKDES